MTSAAGITESIRPASWTTNRAAQSASPACRAATSPAPTALRLHQALPASCHGCRLCAGLGPRFPLLSVARGHHPDRSAVHTRSRADTCAGATPSLELDGPPDLTSTAVLGLALFLFWGYDERYSKVFYRRYCRTLAGTF